MNTFYSESELKELGIKSYGENVLIARNAMLYHPEKLALGHDVRIDDFCIISGNVKIGNYVHISHFCGLYGGEYGIEMYDYSGLSSKVTIYAISDDYSGASMTNPMIPAEFKIAQILGKVVVEKHAIIGAGSMIFPNVTVREGCAVGAMSLCTKSTRPWTVNVGIPALETKERKRTTILALEQSLLKKIAAESGSDV